MRHLSCLVASGLLAFAIPASAATVTVTFAHPENYTDSSYSHAVASEPDRAAVQRDIAAHLQRLAERGLPASDALAIEVLDIDLAGQLDPFRSRSGSDIRVVREVTWPRMTLRYTLSRSGQVIGSAEEHLSDMNFLVSGNRYPGDRLRYEKAMLDDWFEKRFGKR